MLPIYTIGPQTHVLVCFFPFGCILDPERFSNERSLDLEPFRYCMKLCAKRAKLVQLMQKFVQRCLVGNFCNERSRSTPLDPKLMFWCIFFVRVHFEIVSLLHETWCKTRQTGAINAKVRAMMSC